ncbi:unnamed protein product [Clavelina lepadiformis]|uniref:DUF4706 domain-containing protein n=1 Tax=Clavelina lepadiformis TaxID=159417 RepID=A0ABP0F8I7_CLALP
MALWTSDPVKAKIVHKYFASLNPMAAKIIEAKSRIKHSYSKDDWKRMSVAEQEEAINKYIITPDATARYRMTKTEPIPNCERLFPRLVMETGQSYVKCLDDSKDKESWRDEHSSPFAWETRSQMNMSMPKSISQNNPGKNKDEKRSSSTALLNPVLQNGMKERTNGQRNSKNKIKKQTQQEKIILAEEVKVVVLQPKSANQQRLCNESKNKDRPMYSLPNKDQRRPVDQKPKSSSSRINPRVSLTLDGAIRNLEVAMKEEQEAREKAHINRRIPVSKKEETEKPVKNSIEDPNLNSDEVLKNSDGLPLLDRSKEQDETSEVVVQHMFKVAQINQQIITNC